MTGDDAQAVDERSGTPPAAEGPPAAREGAVASEPPVAAEAAGAAAPGPARELTGVVTSSKADKTITVRVDRRVKHPMYGKFVRRSTKLAVHDERNDCRQGDTVTIIETRPISKTKSWRLGAIVERGGE